MRRSFDLPWRTHAHPDPRPARHRLHHDRRHRARRRALVHPCDRDDDNLVVGVASHHGVTHAVDVSVVTESSMPNNVNLASPDPSQPSFISRVIANDAVKKGLAGAAAGLLVAVVSEAIWPTR